QSAGPPILDRNGFDAGFSEDEELVLPFGDRLDDIERILHIGQICSPSLRSPLIGVKAENVHVIIAWVAFKVMILPLQARSGRIGDKQVSRATIPQMIDRIGPKSLVFIG